MSTEEGTQYFLMKSRTDQGTLKREVRVGTDTEKCL